MRSVTRLPLSSSASSSTSGWFSRSLTKLAALTSLRLGFSRGPLAREAVRGFRHDLANPACESCFFQGLSARIGNEPRFRVLPPIVPQRRLFRRRSHHCASLSFTRPSPGEPPMTFEPIVLFALTIRRRAILVLYAGIKRPCFPRGEQWTVRALRALYPHPAVGPVPDCPLSSTASVDV